MSAAAASPPHARRVQAVLFDLDGTLVDSALDITRALNRLRAERGAPPLDPAQVRPWVSLGAPALIARALGEWARGEGDLAAFRAALGSLPADADHLYPGVETALARLDAAGLRLGVVTNKPEGLARLLLEQLDLSRRFGAVVGGDTAAHPKPDPAPVRLALERLAVEADAAVFVGDSLVDARAAQAVGLPFHLYQGGYGPAEVGPEFAARRFVAFDDLADALLREAGAGLSA